LTVSGANRTHLALTFIRVVIVTGQSFAPLTFNTKRTGFRYGGPKGAALISFILNNKKDFDYLSFTSQWPNNFERL
jgi:hypothetical protein